MRVSGAWLGDWKDMEQVQTNATSVDGTQRGLDYLNRATATRFHVRRQMALVRGLLSSARHLLFTHR